jgi:hypothetical protein
MQGTKALSAVAVAVLAVAAGNATPTADSASAKQSSAKAARRAAAIRRQAAILRQSRALLRLIDTRQEETWHWQRIMGESPTPHSEAIARVLGIGYKRWALHLWARRADAARREAQHPPHLRSWLCIHSYEGSWSDSGPPYWGGLQMDIQFQQTYGPRLLHRKGTADHWTPLEQMWVAERAYRSGRGFYPWPNTARYCGLI